MRRGRCRGCFGKRGTGESISLERRGEQGRLAPLLQNLAPTLDQSAAEVAVAVQLFDGEGEPPWSSIGNLESALFMNDNFPTPPFGSRNHRDPGGESLEVDQPECFGLGR